MKETLRVYAKKFFKPFLQPSKKAEFVVTPISWSTTNRANRKLKQLDRIKWRANK